MCAGLNLLAGPGVSAQIEISKTGERYAVVVRDAPLEEVLWRINELEPVELRFLGEPEGTVNVVYRDIGLDDLLQRLGVSYMLVYERDIGGAFHLRDSLMGQGTRSPLSGAERNRVLDLIRDLSGDTPHLPYWELVEMSCDILPLLEPALHSGNYQGQHLAAHIIRRMNCPDYVPTARLVELTLQLLGRDQYDPGKYGHLFGPSTAFEYLYAREDLHDHIRQPLINNLSRGDPQARFLSAVLLAERGETGLAGHLVRILAPHLADNDLMSDGGVSAHALYQLGPAVLPHLAPYRRSTDQQQAELAELVSQALETRDIPSFQPVMYAGQIRNPLDRRPSPLATHWNLEQFPDAQGRYHGLKEKRLTADDYYRHPRYEVPDNEEWFVYVVRPGDTIRNLARDFFVPLDDLLEANPDLAVDEDGTLQSGKPLLIPPS